MSFNVIKRFRLPRLKSIKLSKFNADREGTDAMNFWRQHPRLEAISIIYGGGCWFSNEVDDSLLPNLRHLKVRVKLVLFVI